MENPPHLLLLPRQVPNPPTHVLEPRVPLLRTPHRRGLKSPENHRKITKKSEKNRGKTNKQKEEEKRAATHANPGLVEIGLVEAGDDLLDEVARGAEPSALPEEERGLVGVDPLPHVEDRLQVAIHPIVPRHCCSSSER